MIRIDNPCYKFINQDIKKNCDWLANEVNEVHDAVVAFDKATDNEYDSLKAAEHLAEELADVIELAYTMLYGLGEWADVTQSADEYCQAAIDKVRLKDMMRGSFERIER